MLCLAAVALSGGISPRLGYVGCWLIRVLWLLSVFWYVVGIRVGFVGLSFVRGGIVCIFVTFCL